MQRTERANVGMPDFERSIKSPLSTINGFSSSRSSLESASYFSCTAKRSCQSEKSTRAAFYCAQCSSLQCTQCEKDIHQLDSQSNHKRLSINEMTEECCSVNRQHIAHLYCATCSLPFCDPCYETQHRNGMKMNHIVQRYSEDQVVRKSNERNKQRSETKPIPIRSSNADQPDQRDASKRKSISNSSFHDVKVDDSDDQSDSVPIPINLFASKSDRSVTNGKSHHMPEQHNLDQHLLLDSMLDDKEIGGSNLVGDNLRQSKKTNSTDFNDETFLILDAKESLTVNNDVEFMRQLHTEGNDPSVKCVSIIGNTGDGKSYTLNELFFSGQEKFRTSSTSDSCTLGVWAALDEHRRTLVLDTEGRLGLSQNDNVRNRLLLKILCVSDIIIYRTRAPKLPNDMFQFLSDASNAFHKYFRRELESVMKSCQMDGPMSTVGPTLIVFHETQHTEVLRGVLETQKTPVEQLKERFEKMKLSYDAYSWIEYVGTQTVGGKPTDFSELRATVMSILDNNKVRSPRRLSIIFRALKALNEKFNHNIPPEMPSTLPDDFFACCIKCRSCGVKCTMTANHQKENIGHECSGRCTYNRELDNEVWKCLQCHRAGRDTTVYGKLITKNDGLVQGLLRYVWSGFVIECPHHGEIYRSRKHWYGNSDPKDVTCIEIVHVWPGDNNNRVASDVTPRKFMEMIVYAGSYLSAPTKVITEMVADQVAPSYWIPNKEVNKCIACDLVFGSEFSKHHCRACGQVFCDTCSNYRRIVPWVDSDNAVRVCKSCENKSKLEPPPPVTIEHSREVAVSSRSQGQNNELINVDIPAPRRVYETMKNGLEKIGVNYSLNLIKESTRPNYWKADAECIVCCVCKVQFNTTTNRLHHCRNCGDGVCEKCSPGKQPVPERDWLTPVRVCTVCEKALKESKNERK